MKQGLPRRRAAQTASDPLVVTATEPVVAVTVSGNGELDPARVRPRLAEAAAEGLDGIRKTLLDAATGAVRDHWVTFECGDCGKRMRVEIPGHPSTITPIQGVGATRAFYVAKDCKGAKKTPNTMAVVQSRARTRSRRARR